LGFTIDFAPVLDIDTNPKSPVIGDRSFGNEPKRVIRHALPFARGLRDGGVLPCAKHFPGHGDAALDSHLTLPRIDHERERLEQIEMAPFRAWTRTGLGPVMTAHVIYSALDSGNPASMSRAIIRGELVDNMGFKGAVITDDLEMGAIKEIGGPGRAAISAMSAGSHGLLVCRSEETRNEVKASLTAEATANPLFREVLKGAAERLRPLALPPGPAPSHTWLGSDDHLALQEKLNASLRGMSY
jgi:beta-N-acetylhexosaminidase